MTSQKDYGDTGSGVPITDAVIRQAGITPGPFHAARTGDIRPFLPHEQATWETGGVTPSRTVVGMTPAAMARAARM